MILALAACEPADEVPTLSITASSIEIEVGEVITVEAPADARLTAEAVDYEASLNVPAGWFERSDAGAVWHAAWLPGTYRLRARDSRWAGVEATVDVTVVSRAIDDAPIDPELFDLTAPPTRGLSWSAYDWFAAVYDDHVVFLRAGTFFGDGWVEPEVLGAAPGNAVSWWESRPLVALPGAGMTWYQRDGWRPGVDQVRPANLGDFDIDGTAVHPSGSFVAFASGADVSVVDLRTGATLSAVTLSAPVQALIWAPPSDDRVLVAVDGEVVAIDPDDAAVDVVATLPGVRVFANETTSRSPAFLAFDGDGTVRAWDAQTGATLELPPTGETPTAAMIEPIFGTAFVAYGSLLTSYDSTTGATNWTTTVASPIRWLSLSPPAYGFAWSDAGSFAFDANTGATL